MLPSHNRLRDSWEIQTVFQKGRTVGADWLLLRLYRNPQRDAKSPRIAFVVGLKFSKKAVTRNRAKRILREAVRSHLQKFPPGYDGVFFLSQQASPEKLSSSVIQGKVELIIAKMKQKCLGI